MIGEVLTHSARVHEAVMRKPFMNTQYSIIPGYPNGYTLVFGALFRLGGR